MRTFYIAGWSFVTVAGFVIYRSTLPEGLPIEPVEQPAQVAQPVQPGQPAETSWFESVRARCNPVEVEVMMASNPPPSDGQSQAYAAACYALAGKIERAAERIDALPADQRPGAAGVVFNEGHPVADAGDDDAAGPIMELVLRYWPENYMALYHAGIAEAHLGQNDLARTNLLRFLELYQENDGWTDSARSTLKTLGVTEPGR